MQTLTTLNIAFNYISDIGVQYLANALQKNQVRQILRIRYLHLTQTLLTLNLALNVIKKQGAQYLADALQQNTVRSFFSSSVSHFIYIIFV